MIGVGAAMISGQQLKRGKHGQLYLLSPGLVCTLVQELLLNTTHLKASLQQVDRNIGRTAFAFVICVQLQELLACKTSLETSLKEVDNSIPSLQQQLDATLSSSQETRHNSKALQQEAAELQSVSTVVRKNYIM